MSNKRAPGRSLDEWMELVTECSICQATLSAFGYQFHQFVQGTPWSTFLTHNETSKCSKFLSPIKRSVVKIYLLSL